MKYIYLKTLYSFYTWDWEKFNKLDELWCICRDCNKIVNNVEKNEFVYVLFKDLDFVYVEWEKCCKRYKSTIMCCHWVWCFTFSLF